MIKRFFAALAALGPSLFSPCRRSVNQEQETGELDGLAAELGLGDDAVVIGGQYFKALQAEERWAETRPPGESPLPEAEYDAYRDELNLLNPAPSSLDALIREVCRRYAKSDDVERGRMRDSITMSQFYTLMAFAERSAVLGLREADERHVTDGLTALAMIDSERVDYRDILMALGLVYHVATRVSANAEALLQHAGGLAKPAVAEIFAQWSALTPEDRSLRDSWGHEEVETTHGRGFVGWGFERYEPTIDLLAVAIELSDLFAADDYQPSIEIASELPDVLAGSWTQIPAKTRARRDSRGRHGFRQPASGQARAARLPAIHGVSGGSGDRLRCPNAASSGQGEQVCGTLPACPRGRTALRPHRSQVLRGGCRGLRNPAVIVAVRRGRLHNLGTPRCLVGRPA